MEMTNEEIVRDYNAAANKNKQIKILADLNCVSPGEIRAVLAQAGVPGVKMPERIVKRKAAPASPKAEQEASAPTEQAAPFWQRMEDILNALPEKMPPEAEGIVQDLLQTLFADYLSQRLKGRVRDAS